LVGEREDRDFCEIDFLLAREREQQIERPFEALDVDHHGRLAAGALFAERRFEILRAHELGPFAGSPAIILLKSLRAASASNCSGTLRAARAAAARRAFSPVSIGACAATSCISERSPLQWSATSQPAARAARVRSATLPDSACIDMSSL